MTVLYHGSHVAVPLPLAKAGRNNLDFGKGFYLTTIKEQAQAWAAVVAGRRGRHVKPVVSCYIFDKEKATEDGVRFKEFDKYLRFESSITIKEE